MASSWLKLSSSSSSETPKKTFLRTVIKKITAQRGTMAPQRHSSVAPQQHSSFSLPSLFLPDLPVATD
jgi:hypothetical protein